MGKYFQFVSAVHLCLVKDEKILLLRRANTGFEDGNYSVPAGHIDGNERATHAMIREAQEEIGIHIQESHLKMVHVTHRIQPNSHPSGCNERIDFFFEATQWEGEPKNMEEDKCDHLQWFPINDLPPNMVPYVKAAIEHFRDKIIFSEFGWERSEKKSDVE